MAKAKKSKDRHSEIRNAKASHKYFIGEKFEAGIALKGTEVKSIRAGKAQINESFVRLDGEEAILYNSHIEEYAFGNLNNHNPRRPRKLLLHKREIRKLKSEIEAGGSTVVPLRMYFKGALVKVEIAVCQGKKLHDKRESLKKQEAQREAQRVLRARYK